MEFEDVEERLREAKFDHLTEDELDSYCERRLGGVSKARVDTHLKLCLICERRLTLLKQESAALENEDLTAADAALAKRIRQGVDGQGRRAGSESKRGQRRVSWSDRLADFLRQVVASWGASFGPPRPVYRGVRTGREVWRWEGEDGALKVWAVLEKNADLTIRFSSNESDMEGVRLKIRLGPFCREIILQRRSESEVYGEFVVPKQKRTRNLADISIEIV